MSRSRATVHLKDSGICCFAIVRSMAMATPVVVDRLTYENCFLDSIEGLTVCGNAGEIAAELRRLASDDAYWLERSTATLSLARKQFTCDDDLGQRFCEFLERAAGL